MPKIVRHALKNLAAFAASVSDRFGTLCIKWLKLSYTTNSSGDMGQCVICMEQPKNATLVHGDTGHACCCISCGDTLKERNIPCPICRAPIGHVIKHFLS